MIHYLSFGRKNGFCFGIGEQHFHNSPLSDPIKEIFHPKIKIHL